MECAFMEVLQLSVEYNIPSSASCFWTRKQNFLALNLQSKSKVLRTPPHQWMYLCLPESCPIRQEKIPQDLQEQGAEKHQVS